MKREEIEKIPYVLPRSIGEKLHGAKIYDSSCSPEARVYYIEKDGGYYLKIAARNTLAREAEMNSYFYSKGLGPRVIEYVSRGERDLMLTERVRGEDCTHREYFDDSKRLCDLIATSLRKLHEIDASDCPVKDRMGEYISLVEENFRTGNYDSSHFPDSFGYRSADEAIGVFESGKKELKNEVLIHGDYCLPNIMLDGWRLSGYIDLGNGGIGDRHVDLFWGAWTLGFNLGTDEYRDRFFDAYGRDKIDGEKLKIIAAAEVFG
ncbi:MAG: aminoglycoside 3'-phosphotransferase [Clostridia bacterium]|nr:aminoglycoside 3'-phosphotransferase [Clostridia bacterium]